ncbi:MAG: hypothetical protein ACK53W_06055 [Gemmatimonadota bacterium]|jgi:hypothetical protein
MTDQKEPRTVSRRVGSLPAPTPVETAKLDSRGVLRNPDGTLAKGTKGGPGRPALPPWLNDHAPVALAVIVAQATGRVVPGFEQVEVCQEMAASSDPDQRFAAAKWLAERVYGKAKESVDVSVTEQSTVERVVRVVVESPEARPNLPRQTVVDVLPPERAK